MKNLKPLLAIGVLTVVSLTGCGKKHTHDFSGDWSHDETSHWHTCECGEKDTPAPHEFHWEYTESDRYELCECGYEGKHETPKGVPTSKELNDLVEAFAFDNAVSYDYSHRVYEDDRNTGAMYNNYEEKTAFKFYKNGIDAKIVYDTLEGVYKTTVEKSVEGRFASYNLDDSTFASGMYIPEDDENFYQISEINRYNDASNAAVPLNSLSATVAKMFLTPTKYWSEYSEYGTAVYSIDTVDGNYVATVSNEAPAASWIGAERDTGTIVFNKYWDVVAMSTENLVFDNDFSTDLEADTATVWKTTVSNIEYGVKKSADIPEWDLSKFNDEQITSFVYKPVEVSEGDLSEAKVLEILANFRGYLVGCTSSKCDKLNAIGYNDYYEEYTYEASYSAKRYANDKMSYSNYDENGDPTTTGYIRATDAGVEKVYVSSTTYGYTDAPEGVYSMDAYFNPHCFYIGLGFNHYIIDEFTEVGEYDTGFLKGKKTIKSATCSGNTITLNVVNNQYENEVNEWYTVPAKVWDFTIKIVDNHCTEIFLIDDANPEGCTYVNAFDEELVEFTGNWPEVPPSAY